MTRLAADPDGDGPYQRILAMAHGGPEVLRLVDEPRRPTPGPGQARVKVLAAGTGFTDTLVRRGFYPGIKDRPPLSPGYDIVGTIDALGTGGTSGLQVGQGVADMPVWGGYSQYLVRPASQLVPVPEGIDPAEAACMPLAFMTAYQMLTRYRRFVPGDRILIQGASGTVGTALMALGRYWGLQMWGTASPAKWAVLHRYGCTTIDYRNEDFAARLRQEAPEGVDAIFDAMAGTYWARGYGCLRPGGILFGYGAQAHLQGTGSVLRAAPAILRDFAYLMLRCNLPGQEGRRGVFYNIQTRRRRFPREYADDLQALFSLLAERAIVPEIADRLPLAAAADAHRRIDAGEVTGKIILLPFP